jgi:hypothetical protein
MASAAVMKNADVVRMVRSGTPVPEIIARINASDPAFNLYSDEMLKLQKHGVPAVVIKAMTARQAGDRLQLSQNSPEAGDISLANTGTTVPAAAIAAKIAPGAPGLASSNGSTSDITAKQLNNETVLKLLKSGLGENVIAQIITSRPGVYSTDVDSLISLKQSGVSDRLIGLMMSAGSTAAAHVSYSAAAPIANTGPALILHDGTPVRLRLARNLSSADAKAGETIDFEVLDDVTLDHLMVIPRGAVAIGTVTSAEAKRRMGRGGKLDVTLDFVRLANGQKAALRGVKESKGGGHVGAMTGAIVATSLVVWPAAPFFLFMHGKDTVIPKGTEIPAYIDGEIKLARAGLSVAP